MKKREDTAPPKWATRLLCWYCNPKLLEDLQGDLNEYFERNIKSKGIRRAKLIYVIDVFKFLRLYTVRKPEIVNLLINWIMLGSYIKTSGRNIVRNKLFSTINIVGLAISMSVGLFMIGILSDMLSYDKFHENRDRIYRVISRLEYKGDRSSNFTSTTSLKAAKAISETISGIEDIAILRRGFGGDLKFREKVIPLDGYWANPSMFKVFSFKLIHGSPATALKEPFSIVLTEKSAKKLFGDEEALGKTVIFNKGGEYTVTGVLEDIPTLSHINFDMLGSLSTREVIAKNDKDEMTWDHILTTWAYALLPPNANQENLKASLNQLSTKEDRSLKDTHIELALQPMTEIMIGQELDNQMRPVLGKLWLRIFMALAFVVIISACFNYTNLSIARSLSRRREVGIRKVIGALKSQVIGQFVIEAIIISLCALAVAHLLFLLLRPSFLNIQQGIQELFHLELSFAIIFYSIVFAIAVGVAAGIFPALFFSRINATQVFRNFLGHGSKKLTFRKALIVFQYSISIIFVTFTVIIYGQYKHYIAFDLGFKTDNVLNISLQGNSTEILKKELSELPEVKGISQSLMLTGLGNAYGTIIKNPTNPKDSANVWYNYVDENYLPLLEHKLLAGHNFTARTDSLETDVIVNLRLLKRFNIAPQNPAKAIDEIINVDHKDLHVIGVIRDFHYGGDVNKSEEVVLRYANKNAKWLNVKIQPVDPLATYSKIESIWKKHDTIHPFEAKYYHLQIAENYSGMRALIKVAGFLAFLAICIASMGLLGMVVYTTETRLKEISIRKVMGATEINLIFLMGRGFLLLLVVAGCIGLPITYLFFEKIFFRSANHAPIYMSDLLMGVSAISILAIVMIGSQTLKVARSSPSEVLKND
jgi:putative ABC transport system permease protein